VTVVGENGMTRAEGAGWRELADIEQIKQLKARYCLLLDAQEWAELERLFIADARFEVGSGSYLSASAFVENLRANLAGESHVHIAQMPILELTGPDSARGLWTFSNRGALGHYEDEYARTEAGWRISATTMIWIIPPTEQLLRDRRGAFAPVAERWRSLARTWNPPAPPAG
jgi:SnoaL-like domain